MWYDNPINSEDKAMNMVYVLYPKQIKGEEHSTYSGMVDFNEAKQFAEELIRNGTIPEAIQIIVPAERYYPEIRLRMIENN